MRCCQHSTARPRAISPDRTSCVRPEAPTRRRQARALSSPRSMRPAHPARRPRRRIPGSWCRPISARRLPDRPWRRRTNLSGPWGWTPCRHFGGTCHRPTLKGGCPTTQPEGVGVVTSRETRRVSSPGIPMADAPYVPVGGMGSFVLAAYLRIAVVSHDRKWVLANVDKSSQTYRYLTRVSPIREQGRSRSDSSSCPGNMCGLRPYVIRGAFSGRRLKCLWIVLTQPVIDDCYPPTRCSARGAREPPRRGTADRVRPADWCQRETSGLAALGRHATGRHRAAVAGVRDRFSRQFGAVRGCGQRADARGAHPVAPPRRRAHLGDGKGLR